MRSFSPRVLGTIRSGDDIETNKAKVEHLRETVHDDYFKLVVSQWLIDPRFADLHDWLRSIAYGDK